MNAPFPTPAGAPDRASALPCPSRSKAARILQVAERVASDLARGRPIASEHLRALMQSPFGGSDASGAWVWRDAYEACEAAQVLFLRRYSHAMRKQARTPTDLLTMLSRVAALLPAQTRRSDESQAFQQFSTPIDLAFVAASSRFSRRAAARNWRSTNSPISAPTCSSCCFRRPMLSGMTRRRSMIASTPPFALSSF